MAIVYLITHLASGKRYVGKTIVSVRVRWTAHVSYALTGRGRSLQAAIRKYGAGAFSIEAIETLLDNDAALDAEKRWIALLGTRAPAGYSEEWKQAQSERIKAWHAKHRAEAAA